jgi:hypothetical protein
MPLLGVLIFLCGCGEETAIRSYSVPKNVPRPSAESAAQPAQMLGMIIPNSGSAWFFKLTDRPEVVQSLSADFRKIADSFNFSADGTPRWTLAEGWSEQILRQITYAQFTHSTGATVTLTQLGANTSDTSQWQSYLRENVNRWREQLSLAPQDWAAMEQSMVEVPQHSSETAKAYYVNLNGTQAVGSGVRGPMGQRRSGMDGRPSNPQASAPSRREQPNRQQDEPTRRQLTYTIPEGWLEYPTSGIRLASFEISQGLLSAMVTVTAAGGSIEQSVQMWLAQIGSNPDEQRVSQVVQSAVKRDAKNGNICTTYMVVDLPPDSDVRLAGSPEDASDREDSVDERGAGPSGQPVAIRVTVISLDDRESIFVKMSGDLELVQLQSEKMDQFVDSLSW